MQNKRDYSFDFLRIISMFMVIVIHVSNVYSRSFGIISNKYYLVSLFYNTICRISVPLFFMISGALLLDRNFNKEKYIKRIIRFITIIAFWDILYLLWEYFYLGIKYDKLYMLLFKPFRAHLWFLYTIIMLYIVQPIAKKILDKSNFYIKILLLFIWFSLSALCLINGFLAKYFSFFSYLGYFIIGKYIYDYSKNNNLKKYNILFLSLIIISFSITIILNYKASLRYNMFYNLYFAYRTPFIILSSILGYILVMQNYDNKPHKLIILLSDLSLGVYLIHGIFLDITINKFSYIYYNPVYSIPIFSILIFLSSLIVIFILKKIKISKYIV